MKAVAVIALAGLAAAQFDGLPSCAKTCASKYLQAGIGNCGSDAKCICSDQSFLAGIACCLADSVSGCDAADQSSAVSFASQLCAANGVTVPAAVTCASTAAAGSAGSTAATSSPASASAAASTTASASTSAAAAASTAAAASSTTTTKATATAATTTSTSASSTSTSASSTSASSTSASAAWAPRESAGVAAVGLVGGIVAALALL